MPAYWIAHISVSDAAAYARYAALATDAIGSYGGVFLARGGAYATLEGADRPRHVVVRFPDLVTAEACYRSAAYQAALEHARAGSERELVVVEGLPSAD
jgi:uncharacterized protein (DUF1330 family)